MPYQKINISLDPETMQTLRDIMHRTNTQASHIVRQALRLYFQSDWLIPAPTPEHSLGDEDGHAPLLERRTDVEST